MIGSQIPNSQQRTSDNSPSSLESTNTSIQNQNSQVPSLPSSSQPGTSLFTRAPNSNSLSFNSLLTHRSVVMNDEGGENSAIKAIRSLSSLLPVSSSSLSQPLNLSSSASFSSSNAPISARNAVRFLSDALNSAILQSDSTTTPTSSLSSSLPPAPIRRTSLPITDRNQALNGSLLNTTLNTTLNHNNNNSNNNNNNNNNNGLNNTQLKLNPFTQMQSISSLPLTSPQHFSSSNLPNNQQQLPPHLIQSNQSWPSATGIEPEKRGKKRSLSTTSLSPPQERQTKGLSLFSKMVCDKVEKKRKTTYLEVSDELVKELTGQNNGEDSSQKRIDEKNIRRRVYDALNVLIALNIIHKDRKQIVWQGLPGRETYEEIQSLQAQKNELEKSVGDKTSRLQKLVSTEIDFHSLIARNKSDEEKKLNQTQLKVQIPFIVVKTDIDSSIYCEMKADKEKIYFKFDKPFSIHEDFEILKFMKISEKSNINLNDVLDPRLIPYSSTSTTPSFSSSSSSFLGPNSLSDSSLHFNVPQFSNDSESQFEQQNQHDDDDEDDDDDDEGQEDDN